MGAAAATSLSLRRSPASADAGSPESPASGQFGARVDPYEFNAPSALDPEVLGIVPSLETIRKALASEATRFVLPSMPPVSEQGTSQVPGHPGTCEAQGFAYGLGSHTMARNIDGTPHFDLSDAKNRVSAAWMFSHQAQVENPVDPSCLQSRANPYLEWLVLRGAPSEAAVPYEPDCGYLHFRDARHPRGLDTDVAHYPDAKRLRIGSYAYFTGIDKDPEKYLRVFRTILRAGHIIAFTGLVPPGYITPLGEVVKGAYSPTEFIVGSGHSQLIVGYDDAIGRDGAFLVQNSFGTGWPEPGRTGLLAGRLWWDYNAFFASQQFAAIAYPRADGVLPDCAKMVADVPVADDVYLLSAHRWNTPAGEHKVVVEACFPEPMRLDEIRVRLPNAPEIARLLYGAPIAYGFAGVPCFAAPAAGSYVVQFFVTTAAGDRVDYTAKIDVA